ncbi:hypothetical protein MTO96_014224 [Rhipicephalus appendiculatus]
MRSTGNSDVYRHERPFCKYCATTPWTRDSSHLGCTSSGTVSLGHLGSTCRRLHRNLNASMFFARVA